jgi:putative ABC transport system permease protein
MALPRDLQAAVRSLRKNPGFTSVVVAMLAIGIGATTAMFSVANGVLFAPLPYANENRLVAIVNHGTRAGDNISLLDVLDLRRDMKSLDEIGGVYASPGTLTGEGDPRGLGMGSVTANWFTMLGVRPEIGRVFAEGEDAPGAEPVVMISDGLWRSVYGADRAVLGRKILIDLEPRTVIGVLPPQVALPYKLDLWRPLTMGTEVMSPTHRGNRFFQGVARVSNGFSLDQARAELKTATARIHDAYPVAETGLSFDLAPLRKNVVGDAAPALLVLLAAVGFVLLIACANVASLLLLRARQRSAEMGIRLALGASPGRIMRDVLAESLLYGAAAGALGVLLASAAVRAIVALRPPDIPFIDDVAVDWRVMVFAIAVTLVTTVVFGMAPAIFASKTDLLEALTSGSRSVSAGKRGVLLRQAFVVMELALALVLLVGAGLLGRSFAGLMSVPVGFHAEGLVRFNVTLPDEPKVAGAPTRAEEYPRTRALVEEMMSQLAAVPGTRAVTAGFGAPFTGPAQNQSAIHIEGDPPDLVDRPTLSLWKSVLPGYFGTMGIPLVRGRLLSEQDRSGGHRVVLVNEAFVRAFLRDGDPIGRVVTGHGEIVGVVGDTKNLSLTESPPPAVYYAFDQEPVGYLTVLIRSSAPSASVIATAEKRLQAMNKFLLVGEAGTYGEFERATVARKQFSWQLVAAFSAFALLLAVAGIYSVVAFAVRQRQREFGIRVALGAQRSQVMRLVLSQAATLAALGIGSGVIVALSTSSALRSMLYGVGATDAVTYAAGCAVLIVSTLAASWIPAWRAGRVDPTVVMRSE